MFEFRFPGSLTSTFLGGAAKVDSYKRHRTIPHEKFSELVNHSRGPYHSRLEKEVVQVYCTWGISLVRNRPTLGAYRRTMPRVLGGS